jgi:hypothetical protein
MDVVLTRVLGGGAHSRGAIHERRGGCRRGARGVRLDPRGGGDAGAAVTIGRRGGRGDTSERGAVDVGLTARRSSGAGRSEGGSSRRGGGSNSTVSSLLCAGGGCSRIGVEGRRGGRGHSGPGVRGAVREERGVYHASSVSRWSAGAMTASAVSSSASAMRCRAVVIWV